MRVAAVLFALCICSVLADWTGVYFASTRITPSNTYNSPGEVSNRFTTEIFTRQDREINFDGWDLDNNTWFNRFSMPLNFPRDYFGVHWTAILNVPTDGSYYFRTFADDGVRMMVGNNVVIDAWALTSTQTLTSSAVILKGGDSVHLRVDYYEFAGNCVVTVEWSGPGLAWQILGGEYVTSGAFGWNAEFYTSTLTTPFSAAVQSRRESYLNHNDWKADWYLGLGMPPTLPKDWFAVRYSGFVRFPEKGSYQLRTMSDDGIRVKLNGSFVIDSWLPPHTYKTDTSQSFYIPADNTRLEVVVEYYQQNASTTAILQWLTPKTHFQALGGAYVSNCGNGKVEQIDGEECDSDLEGCKNCVCQVGYGPTNPPTVSCVKLCGNGIWDYNEGEECDQGAGAGTNCNNCKCNPGWQPMNGTSCGQRMNCDGIQVDPSTGEECDGGLGCASCLCGPGYIPTPTPSKDCQLACGNGFVDLGQNEECDGGDLCSGCKCKPGTMMKTPPSANCEPICGNGNLNAGEKCDSGAGCADNCQCKTLWQPMNPPSVSCQLICGNGVLDVGLETCDGGSGCNTECACKSGYKPTSPPSLMCDIDDGGIPITPSKAGAIVGSIFAILIVAVLVGVAYWKRDKIGHLFKSDKKKTNYFPEMENSLFADDEHQDHL